MVAFYAAATVACALFQREALAADAGISPAGTGFPRFSLAHNVASSTEVETTINDAINAGGQLVHKPETAPWGGFRGYFADPDGFLWEVCWNPFFSLDENGFVQLPE